MNCRSATNYIGKSLAEGRCSINYIDINIVKSPSAENYIGKTIAEEAFKKDLIPSYSCFIQSHTVFNQNKR